MKWQKKIGITLLVITLILMVLIVRMPTDENGIIWSFLIDASLGIVISIIGIIGAELYDYDK